MYYYIVYGIVYVCTFHQENVNCGNSFFCVLRFFLVGIICMKGGGECTFSFHVFFFTYTYTSTQEGMKMGKDESDFFLFTFSFFPRNESLVVMLDLYWYACKDRGKRFFFLHFSVSVSLSFSRAFLFSWQTKKKLNSMCKQHLSYFRWRVIESPHTETTRCYRWRFGDDSSVYIYGIHPPFFWYMYVHYCVPPIFLFILCCRVTKTQIDVVCARFYVRPGIVHEKKRNTNCSMYIVW